MTHTITTYWVQGKDRFSDPWTTFETTRRAEALAWADSRAFLAQYDVNHEPVIHERYMDASDR